MRALEVIIKTSQERNPLVQRLLGKDTGKLLFHQVLRDSVMII